MLMAILKKNIFQTKKTKKGPLNVTGQPDMASIPIMNIYQLLHQFLK